MKDPRITQIADILVNYSLGIQPGQKLLLRGGSAAEPLIKATYREALRAGALVTPQISLPGMAKIFFDEANSDQLKWVQPLYRMASEEFDAYLAIESDTNSREGTNYNREKQAILGSAIQPVRDTFMRRAADGKLKWCVTLFPTNAYAQDAGMSLEEYEDFVFGACLPDPKDPVGFWKTLESRQDRLADRLKNTKSIRLCAEDTDLVIGVAGRNWINCCGRENFPDGEIFTGPQEDRTEGKVRFSYPAVHQGTEVTDVSLEFKKGRVTRATAATGYDFLNDMLNRDDGARILGEFAIGTNPGITRFTRHTLFDEKIEGTIHMALGMAYPESGGTNMSQIHWDMVCDLRNGGKLFADDKLIYENGKFVIDI
jgi:aminopeptidase